MEVAITYSVPVICHVDTDSGEVVRVVVCDAEASREDLPGGLVEAYDPNKIVPLDIGQHAIQIAESQDWPAWEFGY